MDHKGRRVEILTRGVCDAARQPRGVLVAEDCVGRGPGAGEDCRAHDIHIDQGFDADATGGRRLLECPQPAARVGIAQGLTVRRLRVGRQWRAWGGPAGIAE